MVPHQVIANARRRFIRSLSYSERQQVKAGTHEINAKIEELQERLSGKLNQAERVCAENELREYRYRVELVKSGWTGY